MHQHKQNKTEYLHFLAELHHLHVSNYYEAVEIGLYTGILPKLNLHAHNTCISIIKKKSKQNLIFTIPCRATSSAYVPLFRGSSKAPLSVYYAYFPDWQDITWAIYGYWLLGILLV